MTTCLLVVVVVLVFVCLNNRLTALDGCDYFPDIRCGQELCGRYCKCAGGESIIIIFIQAQVNGLLLHTSD